MNRLCVIIILLFWVCKAYAATSEHTVRGVARDKLEQSLPGVIITANDADSTQLSYAITAEDGSFEMTFETSATVIYVEAGMLGYKTMSKRVDLPQRGLLIFNMTPDAIELKEVHVTAKPIRAQGDTLIFNVASFKSAADRSIEDVIKRMPGIQVLENGSINYNGLPINRFYIEKLDMLQGNYTLATKNISAEDIATVDVYEEHQPVKVLENIEHSDKAAINLTLKKKSMLRPIGTVKGTGGYGGSRGIWAGEGNMMLITPKFQSMIVGKAGNTGKSYADENIDYSDMTIRLNTVASSVFTNNLVSQPPLARQRFDYNRSALASANILTKLGNDRTISVNLSYTNDRSDVYGEENTYYFREGTDLLKIMSQAGSLMQTSTVRGRVTYQSNSEKAYISEQLAVNGTFRSNDYTIRGSNVVDQSLDADMWSISNTLTLTLRHGNRVWDVNSALFYGSSPEGGISAYAPGAETPYLVQHTKGKTLYNSERTSMIWLIGSHGSIGASLSFMVNYDTFDSHFDRENDSQPTATGRNDVNGYKITTELAPFFLWQNQVLNWRIDVPVTMTDMSYDDKIDDTRYKHHRPRPGVTAQLNYELKKRFRFNLSGGYRQRSGSISNFITNPVYRTYRMYSALGSGRLGEFETASMKSGISYRNAIRAFFTSLTWECNFNKSNSTSISNVTDNETSTSFSDAGSHSRDMSVTFNISKRIRPVNTTLKLNASWQANRSECIRNGIELQSDVNTISINGSARGTLLSDRVAISVSGSYSRSSQRSDAGNNRSVFDDLSTRLELSLFPIKAIEMFGHATYQRTQISKDKYTNPVFVDAGVRYSIKKWEIELRLNNLTNRKTFAYQFFVGPDRFERSFRLRPAEALLSAKLMF